MPGVSSKDLLKLGEVCSSVCFHLTAHLAAVAAGLPPPGPPEVAQIYQLASKLPAPEAPQWAGLAYGKPGAAAGAGGAAAAAGPAAAAKKEGKRLKWTPALEQELMQLVEDEDFRMQKLGKEGTRGGNLNWSSVARHFGFAATGAVKTKYAELKGEHLPDKPAKKTKKEDGADDEGEKPAVKKPKTKPAPPAAAAAAPAPAPAPTPTAAPAGETPGGGTPGADVWSKKQGQELVQLVEDEDQRKEVLGKKKLRWKRIAEHFGKKVKACRKHYHKLSGKEVPEDED